MMHGNRTFNVCRQADLIAYAQRMFGPMITNRWEALAHVLTETTSVLCAAYEVEVDGFEQTVVFLNDSTSEDGAQEYAVVLKAAQYDSQIVGSQVESITVGWMKTAEFLEWALGFFGNLGKGPTPMMVSQTIKIDSSEDHRCRLCA